MPSVESRVGLGWVIKMGKTQCFSWQNMFWLLFHITFLFLAGVSLLIQDSEIAESQGISAPRKDDDSVKTGVHDALQGNRRRASTGSSTISEAGSEIEGYGQPPLQAYGV